MRPLLLALLALLLLAAPARAATPAAVPLPPAWPGTLQLGVRDDEGGATELATRAGIGVRYHYLSGGWGTGRDWTTWTRGDGTFVPAFIEDSAAHGHLPLFSLYELRESVPGASMEEQQGILTNLRTRATMRGYFEELRLFFQRAAETGKASVLHVEPDIWGYIQRNGGASVPAEIAATGLPELAGLPNTAAGYAQAFVRLRDRYAPKVLLGYHFSTWGTGEDPAYSDPTDARIDELADQAAAYYRSLGADFDLLFAEYTDRDAGFRQRVNGDGGASYWTPEDFQRHVRLLGDLSSTLGKRVVLWQIPVGNSQLDDTPGRYRDTRVETLLQGAAGRRLLQQYVDAGVIGMLFGHALDGATTVKSDNGLFFSLAAEYARQGPLRLPGGTKRPAAAAPSRVKAPRMRFTTTGPRTVTRGRTATVRVRITSASAARVLVAIQFYAPGSSSYSFQLPFKAQRFKTRIPRTYVVRYKLPASAPTGQWTVKVGVFDPDWKRLLLWRDGVTRFTVR